jgi:hypothetical protein
MSFPVFPGFSIIPGFIPVPGFNEKPGILETLLRASGTPPALSWVKRAEYAQLSARQSKAWRRRATPAREEQTLFTSSKK